MSLQPPSIEVSLVSPAFNEESNLNALYEKLIEMMENRSFTWEWIVVDDHSEDGTFELIDRISKKDPRVKGVRLSRNCGSHIALTCGLNLCRGRAALCLAADLQDPPEVIEQLIAIWKSGKQVVWGVRSERIGESFWTKKTSLAYYWIMRKVVGMRDMPPTGADVFLIDRRVIDSIKRFKERNISLFALITWLGYRQGYVTYAKQARHSGVSGWNFKKKVRLAIDSIVGFSNFPVRWISYLGGVIALTGFVVAVGLIVHVLTTGTPPEGWTSVMVSVLVIGGIQIVMLGILGEYVWRGVDESRRRPAFLIENVTGEWDSEDIRQADT